jgi:F-type H+-transporting ATPase subunit c
VARQPEAAGDIRGVTIITAAFIEGVCLFAVVIALLVGFLQLPAMVEMMSKPAGG